MKNKSLNVPASALTGSSTRERVDAATLNNFRALAEPGKSLMRFKKLKTKTHAITSSATATERTAGLRASFFHVHGDAAINSLFDSHWAVSAGMGMALTTAATARSKFCWVTNFSEPFARDKAERMARSRTCAWLIGAQSSNARWRRDNRCVFIPPNLPRSWRPARLETVAVPQRANATAR